MDSTASGRKLKNIKNEAKLKLASIKPRSLPELNSPKPISPTALKTLEDMKQLLMPGNSVYLSNEEITHSQTKKSPFFDLDEMYTSLPSLNLLGNGSETAGSSKATGLDMVSAPGSRSHTPETATGTSGRDDHKPLFSPDSLLGKFTTRMKSNSNLTAAVFKDDLVTTSTSSSQEEDRGRSKNKKKSKKKRIMSEPPTYRARRLGGASSRKKEEKERLKNLDMNAMVKGDPMVIARKTPPLATPPKDRFESSPPLPVKSPLQHRPVSPEDEQSGSSSDVERSGPRVLLASRIPLAHFLVHLIKEMSPENLLFYVDAFAFERDSFSFPKTQLRDACRIRDLYLSSNSVLELNLDAKTKKLVLERINEALQTPDVFVLSSKSFLEAKMSVLKMMEDSFRVFKASQAYDNIKRILADSSHFSHENRLAAANALVNSKIAGLEEYIFRFCKKVLKVSVDPDTLTLALIAKTPTEPTIRTRRLAYNKLQ